MKFSMYCYNDVMNKKMITGIFVGALGVLGVLTYITIAKTNHLQDSADQKIRDLEKLWVGAQYLESSHLSARVRNVEVTHLEEFYCYQEGDYKVGLLFNDQSKNYSFYYVDTNLIQEGSFENVDELEKGEYRVEWDKILLTPKSILKKEVAGKLARTLHLMEIDKGVPVEMNLLARTFRSPKHCDSIFNEIIQLK